jgi:16S rRNA (uracil1498-N3)-methyltransferase
VSAPRFFVAPEEAMLQADTELRLPDAVVRHALQVLRLRNRAAIVLFDGRGGEYRATLHVSGRTAYAHIGAHVAIERETAVPVTLVQSLVAADVMDDIVRKAVELGAATIVPVLAERSQRAPAERLDKRTTRWSQIAIAACAQCGRNRIPDIASVAALGEWMQGQDLAHGAVLDPGASAALATVAARRSVGVLIVGPEGGLTTDEVKLACARGARAAHMGARILRADTAAVSALATLNAVADARAAQ